ncbi:hypothetical protein Tco_0285665 [Tanacetum coccineum]
MITHQGNKQVKDNKIDLFVQKYEEFVISDDETIDCAFARFNTIITSLKALDESFSSRNHVRKFSRALPTKWRPKVYEVVFENDSEASKTEKEKYKSLALKAKKVSSDKETSCSGSDEEYAMVVRDFKKLLRRRGKFVRQPLDDKKSLLQIKEENKGKEERRCFKRMLGESEAEDDSKRDEVCLMVLDNNEVLSDTPYYSSSSLDSESLQNKYNKLCKISLRIINENKLLKTRNEILDNKVCNLKSRIEGVEKNKEVSVECES